MLPINPGLLAPPIRPGFLLAYHFCVGYERARDHRARLPSQTTCAHWTTSAVGPHRIPWLWPVQAGYPARSMTFMRLVHDPARGADAMPSQEGRRSPVLLYWLRGIKARCPGSAESRVARGMVVFLTLKSTFRIVYLKEMDVAEPHLRKDRSPSRY